MPEPEITNRIRELRFANGEMSQQELADRCECTRQTIIALEKQQQSGSVFVEPSPEPLTVFRRWLIGQQFVQLPGIGLGKQVKPSLGQSVAHMMQMDGASE